MHDKLVQNPIPCCMHYQKNVHVKYEQIKNTFTFTAAAATILIEKHLVDY